MKHKEINFDHQKWNERQEKLRDTLIEILKYQGESGQRNGRLYSVLLSDGIYKATAISAVMKTNGHLQNTSIGGKKGFRIIKPENITVGGFSKYLIRQAVKRDEINKQKNQNKKDQQSRNKIKFDVVPVESRNTLFASSKESEALDAIFEVIFKSKITGLSEDLEHFITSSEAVSPCWNDYVNRVFSNTKKSA